MLLLYPLIDMHSPTLQACLIAAIDRGIPNDILLPQYSLSVTHCLVTTDHRRVTNVPICRVKSSFFPVLSLPLFPHHNKHMHKDFHYLHFIEALRFLSPSSLAAYTGLATASCSLRVQLSKSKPNHFTSPFCPLFSTPYRVTTKAPLI
jgi:hypothetical protein